MIVSVCACVKFVHVPRAQRSDGAVKVVSANEERAKLKSKIWGIMEGSSVAEINMQRVSVDAQEMIYFEWIMGRNHEQAFVRLATKHACVLVCIRLASSHSAVLGRTLSIRRLTYENQWICYEEPQLEQNQKHEQQHDYHQQSRRYHLSIFNGQDKPVTVELQGPLQIVSHTTDLFSD